MLVQEKEPAASKKSAPIGQLLLILLALLFGGWFLLVFTQAYNFTFPLYQDYFKTNAGYLGDIFSKLPRGLELFWGLGLFLFCNLGVGSLVLKLLRLEFTDEWEHALLSIASGLPLFTFVTLAIGTAGFLQREVLLGLLAVAFIASLWYSWQVLARYRQRSYNQELKPKTNGQAHALWGDKPKTALILVLAGLLIFYLYLALLGGLTPFLGGDAGWYYIGPSVHYAARNRIYDFVTETRLAVAALTPYQPILYTALIKLGGLGVAKLLNWAYALLTVLAIIYFCRVHFQSLLMGLWAALLFISVPVVSWSATVAYIDLPLCFFGLLMLHAFLRWQTQPPKIGWLVLIGMLGGYATGTKLFGAFTLILIALAVLYTSVKFTSPLSPATASNRGESHENTGQNEKFDFYPSTKALIIERSLSAFMGQLAIGLGALIFAFPWAVRSYTTTGNPIFPSLNSLFKSPYWNNVADQFFFSVTYQLSNPGIDTTPLGFLILPWASVTENNKYWSIISPVFLVFLPICLFVWLLARTSAANLYRLLAIYLIVWSLIWFFSGSIQTRYTMPVMPVAAILIAFTIVKQPFSGLAGQILRYTLGTALFIMLVLNNQLLVSFQSKDDNFDTPTGGLTAINWNYLYRGSDAGKSFDEMLQQSNTFYRYVNNQMSVETDKIYDTTGLLVHELIQLKVPVFNGANYDGPTYMGQWSLFTPDALPNLRREKITFIAIRTPSALSLQVSPVWNYLHEAFSDERITLYGIDYPAEIKTKPPENLAMPVASRDGQTLFMGCFDNQPYANQRQPSGNWGSWSPTNLAKVPDAPVTDITGRYGDGTVVSFMRGKDNILYTRRQNRDGSWGNWQSLTMPVLDNPAVATNRDGSVTVFVRDFYSNLVSRKSQPNGTWVEWWQVLAEGAIGTPLIIPGNNGNFELIARVFNGRLYHRQQFNGKWQDWQALGEGINYDPVVWRSADGKATIFVLGRDGGLYTNQQLSKGGWWRNWQVLGECFDQAPAVAPLNNGLEVYASRANQLYSRQQINGVWQSWQSAGITSKGKPVFSPVRANSFTVLVRGTDNKLYSRQKKLDGQWQGDDWQVVAENIADDPVIGQNKDGSLEIFDLREGNQLYSRPIPTPGQYTGDWELVGTEIYSRPVAAQNPDGTLEIFVRGKDNNVYSRRKQPDGQWGIWQELGFKLQGQPAVGRNKDGTLEVFVRGLDNNLYSRKKQPDDQWQGWELLGQNLTSDPVAAPSGSGTVQVIVQTDNKGFYSRQRLPDGSWQNEWFLIPN